MIGPEQTRFIAELRDATNLPLDAYRALETLSVALVGAKLFTVMVRNEKMGWSQRAYSSMPDAYPVSGTKPINRSHWSQIVVEEKRTFVANDIEAIAAVFPDWELIRSLGCESVINVPIFIAGEMLGTVNLLHKAGYYTEDRVATSEALKLPGAVCLLLSAHGSGTGVR